MRRLRALVPSLSALAFPLSWQDALASMRSAPEVLFWAALCVFGYANYLAVPKPDKVQYSSRGFDVRFVPLTGQYPHDAVEKRIIARETPALELKPGKQLAVRSADEVPFFDQTAAKAAAAKAQLAAASAPGDEAGQAPAYSMASFGAPAAAASLVKAGLAFVSKTPRGGEALLAASSQAEAARSAPRLTDAQKAAAGATPGLLRSLWPATVRVLLDSKAFNDSLYANAFAKQACGDPKFLGSYLADGKADDGVKQDTGRVLALLEDPSSARAAAKTEFAKRLLECPSVQKLAADKDTVALLARENPDLLKLARNPVAAEILRGNEKAAPLYDDVLAALPGPTRP